jgi:hypothetical protein
MHRRHPRNRPEPPDQGNLRAPKSPVSHNDWPRELRLGPAPVCVDLRPRRPTLLRRTSAKRAEARDIKQARLVVPALSGTCLPFL